MNPFHRLLTIARLACGLALIATATGQVVRFGHSCRFNTNECLTKNTQFTTNTTLPITNAWIYLRVTAPSGGLNVSGFSLLLRSTSTSVPNVRVATRLLAATASNAPGAVLEDGKPIYVDSTQRWCTTWFPEHSFSSGTVFYIGYQNPASGVSLGGTSNSSGLNVNWYYRVNGGSLSSQQVAKWKYKIVCDGGSPNVRTYSPPVAGTDFSWGVDNTPGGNFAVPFYGFSNAQGVVAGSVHPLPLDLTFVGAPQCDVNVSPEVFPSPGGTPWGYPFAGNTWRTDLYLPPIAALVGLRFFGQWVIQTPGANPLGFSTSDALEIHIQ